MTPGRRRVPIGEGAHPLDPSACRDPRRPLAAAVRQLGPAARQLAGAGRWHRIAGRAPGRPPLLRGPLPARAGGSRAGGPRGRYPWACRRGRSGSSASAARARLAARRCARARSHAATLRRERAAAKARKRHAARAQLRAHAAGSGSAAGAGADAGSGAPAAAGVGSRPGASGAPADGSSAAADNGSDGADGTPLDGVTPPPPVTGGLGGLGGGFVRGVTANLLGWGAGAAGGLAGEMSSLGVSWTREDLKWSDVEPQRGVFDWSAFDAMLASARAHGISVLPVVGYAPAWAAPGDASDYAAFVAAAVARYGPGTTADLQWFELWNEPYYTYAWSGQATSPAAYALDVRAAAVAAKAVAPSVRVLMAAEDGDTPAAGGGWWSSSVDDYFHAVPDLGRWIDGVAVHPYGDDPALGLAAAGGWKDAQGGWSFARIDSIRASFLAHGVDVPFWITEVGVSTADVSPAAQAQYYADLIPAVRARPWVRALFPYCLREFNAHPTDDQPGFGLESYGSWAPKPAYDTLQQGLTTLQ